MNAKTGETIYKDVTDNDFAVSRATPVTDPALQGLAPARREISYQFEDIANNLALLADKNGVISADKLAKFMASQHSDQLIDLNSACQGPRGMEKYVEQMNTVAEMASYQESKEGRHLEVHVPSLATLRRQTSCGK